MQVYSVQTYYKFKERKTEEKDTEFEESSDAEVKRQRLSENKVERHAEEKNCSKNQNIGNYRNMNKQSKMKERRHIYVI